MFFGRDKRSNRAGGSHVLQSGETLSGVAKNNGCDVSQILAANPQISNPNSVAAGMNLRMPTTARATRASKPQATAPMASIGATMPTGAARSLNFNAPQRTGASSRQYLIVPGDSLSKIARDYGTSVSTIKKINGLKNDTIVAGRTLNLASGAAGKWPVSPLAKKPAPRPAAAKKQRAYKAKKAPHAMSAAASSFSPVKTVRVSQGDSLQKVADRAGISVMALQRLNNMKSDVIFSGQELRVSGPPKASSPKKVTMLKNIRMGWRRTTRRLFGPSTSGGGVGGPIPGVAVATTAQAAHCASCKGKKVRRSRKLLRAQSIRMQPLFAQLRFAPPVQDGYISSPFGARWGGFHEGVDVAADTGTPIVAADDGVVTYAGWKGGYGYLVNLEHDGGFQTRYGHCSYIQARPGQRVRQGQVIAAVGNTGNTTGPHLHYEIRRNGQAMDPFQYGRLY
mmetsp:Transcript_68366/g.216332  ORF Transcript_68366/g.216332 Transcript_68366/m.216332 type:complete len:451 (+) Transcript_68366:376-1728(+)